MKPDKCEVCDKPIHWKVAKYSINSFGKYLCIKHQHEERNKKYPVKLAKYLNNQSYNTIGHK